MAYRAAGVPLVVIAGKEYGTGSSRDWAAKGPALLGVRAVLARVVRADPPLEPGRHGHSAAAVPDGQSAETLGLTGHETFSITGLAAGTNGPFPPT